MAGREIAQLRPGKRRRLRYLADNRPDLYVRHWNLFPDSDEFIFAEHHNLPDPRPFKEHVRQEHETPFGYNSTRGLDCPVDEILASQESQQGTDDWDDVPC